METTSQEIETHLQECAQCCDRLQELDTDDDPLLGQLRRIEKHDGQPDIEPTAETLIHPQSPFSSVHNESLSAGRILAQRITSPHWPKLADYEILDEVGWGGMGIVYRARHIKLGRMVALKMIRGVDQASPEHHVRFQREAQALARLQHANIVHIYETGTCGQQPYFAMEFVDGSNLEEYLDGKPLPATIAGELVRVLAEAVALCPPTRHHSP